MQEQTEQQKQMEMFFHRREKKTLPRDQESLGPVPCLAVALKQLHLDFLISTQKQRQVHKDNGDAKLHLVLNISSL